LPAEQQLYGHLGEFEETDGIERPAGGAEAWQTKLYGSQGDIWKKGSQDISDNEAGS
jgi:hypothetical protein